MRKLLSFPIFVPILVLAIFTSIELNAKTAQAGIFRFLTESLPDGTTNGEYSAALLIANASGAVTFSVSAGSLPDGLLLDASTGQISGLPTTVGQSNVTFSANDGTSTIFLSLTMKINAAGGGGNSGASISNTTLPDGKVEDAYTDTIQVQNGTGPYIFCADGLPSGISFNGLTGEISGTPDEAGNFFVTFTVTDTGENNNKIIKILAMLVLPAHSDFKFTTTMLNNGEVGTSYNDTWQVTGNKGPNVEFSASGLPSGLSVDSATGVVSGDPSKSGKFCVNISASDNTDTISTNLTMLIVPSSTSHFYWDFTGIPAAIYNIEFGRQPPILVAAANGTSVTYSAIGLPQGINYNSTTGELSGVTTHVGVFPVIFTATDSATEETLTYNTDFLVLPPDGGDAKDLAVNLWIKSQQIRSGTPGKDSWKATFIYNADRRTGYAFNPVTDSFNVSVGARSITLNAGDMILQKSGIITYKTPKETAPPIVSVKINPQKQLIQLATSKDTITETFPSEMKGAVILGNTQSYRVDEYNSEKGKFEVTSSYRSTCLVVSNGLFTVKGAGLDSATLELFFANPSFEFVQGDNFSLKVTSDSNTFFDKDTTGFLTVKPIIDTKKNVTWYVIKKSIKDTSAADQLKKLNYSSKTGKISFAISKLDLTGLLAAENQISIELTIKDKTYFTSVSVFETKTGSGKYSTKSPVIK